MSEEKKGRWIPAEDALNTWDTTPVSPIEANKLALKGAAYRTISASGNLKSHQEKDEAREFLEEDGVQFREEGEKAPPESYAPSRGG